MQTKRIEAYNLMEFVQKIVHEVKDGYDIDFKDNTSIPSGGAGYYRCIMHKGAKVAALLKPKPETEIEQQVNGITASDIPKSEPFVPSIVFEVTEPEKKPRGRPKASQV